MPDVVASIHGFGGQSVALLVVGLIAGIVNVLAGGGGLLAMPALVLFAGLGDTTANGTFRIAVMAQSIAAVWQFRRSGRSDLGTSLRLSWPVFVGAGLGAWQAATLGDGGTRKLIIGATLLATIGLVIGEKRLTPAIAPTERRSLDFRLAAGLLVAGWYGGLIQAGVGFALLLVLRGLGGFDLARANVLKVELVLWYTPLAIWLFAGASHLELAAGASLAVGMAVGAWFGATLTIGPQGAARIRIATVAMVLVAAARLALLQMLWIGAAATLLYAVAPSAAWADGHDTVSVLASIEPRTLLGADETAELTSRAQETIQRCAGGRQVVLWLTIEQERRDARKHRRKHGSIGLRATSRLQVDGTTLGERVVRGSTPTALIDAAALLTCVALERLPAAPPRMAAAGFGDKDGRRARAGPEPPPAPAATAPPATSAPPTPGAAAADLPGVATATRGDPPPATRSWGVSMDLGAEASALPATSGRARLAFWASSPATGWRRSRFGTLAWRGALGWEAATSAETTFATRHVVASRWAFRATIGGAAGPVSLDLGPSVGRVSLRNEGLPGASGLWLALSTTLQVRVWRFSDVDLALQADVGRMLAPIEVRLSGGGGQLWRSTDWHGSVGVALRWRVGPGSAIARPAL